MPVSNLSLPLSESPLPTSQWTAGSGEDIILNMEKRKDAAIGKEEEEKEEEEAE